MIQTRGAGMSSAGDSLEGTWGMMNRQSDRRWRPCACRTGEGSVSPQAAESARAILLWVRGRDWSRSQ